MQRRKVKGPQLPDRPRPTAVKDETQIVVSFRHTEIGGAFCLSRCTKDEIRHIINTLRLLTSQTWVEVMRQGGKPGKKTGLGPTPYPDSALRSVSRPQGISPDLQIIGIRASEKSRVFGARHEHTYFVLWFDPNHHIVPA
jgi:hypothetical protein